LIENAAGKTQPTLQKSHWKASIKVARAIYPQEESGAPASNGLENLINREILLPFDAVSCVVSSARPIQAQESGETVCA
jgi:hypothetical protein